MEFGLGQLSGKGSGGAFRMIHKRLPGIGYASGFASFVIACYYNIILGHGLIYFAYAFTSPMPWAGWRQDFPGRCDPKDTSRAEEIFNVDILRYYDADCKDYEDTDPTTFSLPSFFAMLAVWFLCYFCIFWGIRSVQHVVWWTVPVPIVFLIILIIKNATLPGAGDGVKKYLGGDGVTTVTEAAAIQTDAPKGLSDRTMWVDAAGQVFFSLGTCMGIMTAYSSHTKRDKPVLGDAVTVSVADTLVSFLAGFAIWTVIGFLEFKDNLTKNET